MNDILSKVASQPGEVPLTEALSGGKGEVPTLDWVTAGWRYQIDVWQRTLLLLDTLLQRADNAIEHERAGMPPLLDFEYETHPRCAHFQPSRQLCFVADYRRG